MRHLVACPECRRQYDVHNVEAGKRFRCRCGAVVTVAAPRDHEARVVRCSSCGAPWSEGSRACDHCGADFTLHDRDLNTVCPECCARVSDHARYCPQCGTLLAPEEEIGAATELHCPACRDGPRLHSRQLGRENVAALECDVCAGLWLGVEVFDHLARHARESEVPPVTAGREHQTAPRPDPPPQRPGYRPCPRCGALMNRRNYGSHDDGASSGVVLDYCKDDGLWFDCGELAAVLAWLKQGGQPERPDLTRPPDPHRRTDGDLKDASDEAIFDGLFGRRFLSARSGLGRLIDLLFNVRRW